jgi:hypothetical protein
MKKTSVYLEPELDRALGRAAAAEGRSKAELIREGIALRVRGAERPRIQAIGVAGGPGDVADNTDRYLAETGFGDE